MAFDRRRRERGLRVLNSLASFSITAPCTLSLSLSLTIFEVVREWDAWNQTHLYRHWLSRRRVLNQPNGIQNRRLYPLSPVWWGLSVSCVLTKLNFFFGILLTHSSLGIFLCHMLGILKFMQSTLHNTRNNLQLCHHLTIFRKFFWRSSEWNNILFGKL